MFKASIKPMQTTAPKTVPDPGSVSATGPSGKAPAPRGPKNTRNYGKTSPSSMPIAPPQPPPSPFGNSRLGGI